MSDLYREGCVPCRGGAAVASKAEIERYRRELPDWELVERQGVARLVRSFRFNTFKQALDFTNRVAAVAEQEQHHPALLTEWGKVTVSWWTHKIGGLHRNDFIMAAKTDRLFEDA